jgi:hypothetical protein
MVMWRYAAALYVTKCKIDGNMDLNVYVLRLIAVSRFREAIRKQWE